MKLPEIERLLRFVRLKRKELPPWDRMNPQQKELDVALLRISVMCYQAMDRGGDEDQEKQESSVSGSNGEAA